MHLHMANITHHSLLPDLTFRIFFANTFGMKKFSAESIQQVFVSQKQFSFKLHLIRFLFLLDFELLESNES
jgi:hypothetical protein